MCCCVLSVLRDPVLPGSVRKQVYVEDPVLAIRGTPQVCIEQIALALLAWAVLGISLATAKGQAGVTVNWIGATFTVVE